MKRLRDLVALVLAIALVSISFNVLAQKKRTTRRRRPAAAPVSPKGSRQASVAQRADTAEALEPRLSGLWILDPSSSNDPRRAAENAASNRAFGDEQRVIEKLTNRLNSPEKLSIERRGNVINMASSRAPRVSFQADGREHTEAAADGHTVRTRATLYGAQLMVSLNGSRDDDFNVTFDPIEGGRRLRVTRRVYSEEVGREVVVQSIYNKSSQVARWTVYGEPEAERTAMTRPNSTREVYPPATGSRPTGAQTTGPQPAPPATIRNIPQPQPAPPLPERDAYVFVLPAGIQFVAVLNNDLSTSQAREGDRFSLTVREPGQYEGAIIEGYVSHISRSGPFSGRSEMRLDFSQIRLRDGRTAGFAGDVESVRPIGDEDVRIDREASTTVEDSSNQTSRTAQRAAIGAAVGAIIGAISGGGKGAAIGAAIGAGVGAGSVYVQGRDDLELKSGTELSVRTKRPE